MVGGHPSLPVGVVFVPIRIQDRCWFRLLRPAEDLFPEAKEVCALGVWPWHGPRCGGLGGVVRDRGLVEDDDAGVGFRRRWLLGIGGRRGGPSLARAPSGVEEVDDTLSWRRLAAPLLGLWQGPCVVNLACVLGAGEVLCDGGAELYGDHPTTFLVEVEFDGSPHLLVVGSGWVPFAVHFESLVLSSDVVPMSDLTCGPYPRGEASGCGVFEA